jgi:hypothetical protein
MGAGGQRKKKQHFVPQMYLRRFAHEGRIAVFDKPSGKVFPANVKDVAQERLFYDIPAEVLADVPEGYNPQFVEDHLAETEAVFSTEIEALLNRSAIRVYPREPADLSGGVRRAA